MKKTVWSDLDHKIWKRRSEWPPFKKLLIAFSGGVDSTALLSIFHRLSGPGNFEVLAAHIHHGDGPTKAWRDTALESCRQVCAEHDIPFVHGGPSVLPLGTEEQMRDYRYQEMRRLKEQHQCDFILTAHHADDLLETRLLRLLRGTGPLGLAALLPLEGDLWRPLLESSRGDLLDYVNKNQLKFLEDPSNSSLDPQRNWVRHELIPFLDARQEGMSATLGRSLQHLVEAMELPLPIELTKTGGNGLSFSRQSYWGLSKGEQRRLIATVFAKLGLRDYSHGQIEEILKRLDNPQIVHTFTLRTVLWSIDAKQVLAEISPSYP